MSIIVRAVESADSVDAWALGATTTTSAGTAAVTPASAKTATSGAGLGAWARGASLVSRSVDPSGSDDSGRNGGLCRRCAGNRDES